MTKIWRNRLALVAAVAVLLIMLANATPLVRIVNTPDPATYIEEQGYVDVLYYGYELSSLWGSTPGIHIAILYYPPTPAEMPYYIRLTPNGWDILGGKLDWEPGSDEYRNVWDARKYSYFQQNAMFKPGESERVEEALLKTFDWWQEALYRDLWYRLLVVAGGDDYDWNMIELDVLSFASPYTGATTFHLEPGFLENGKPIYVAVGDSFSLMATQALAQKGYNEDGSAYYPATEIPAKGELTDEDLARLMETKQLQFIPVQALLRQYEGGFNHPWQGREIPPS